MALSDVSFQGDADKAWRMELQGENNQDTKKTAETDYEG